MKDKLTGSKDDLFLPSIRGPAREGGPGKVKHATPRKSKSTEETSLPSCLPSSRMFKNGKKLYSSAPTSESSTPFKLPSIHRSKSNSVSNLAVDGKLGVAERNSDLRAKLTSSPSCPSLFDFHESNINILSQHGVGAKKTRQTQTKEVPSVILPSIAQHYDGGKNTFTTPRVLGSLGEQNTLITPRSTQAEAVPKGDNRDVERPPQSYALLLPITSSPRSHVKRRSHKRKGASETTDTPRLGSILKDKLMAIESRDRSSHTMNEEKQRNDTDDQQIQQIQ